MRYGIVLGSVTGTVLATTTMVSGATDPLVYDNYVSGYTAGLSASQLDPVYPFNAQVADDFVLTGAFSITGMTWNGGYFNGDPLPDPSDFNLIFYADAGGMPTGGGLPTPEDTALAVFEVASADITRTDNGDGSFEYTADLGGSIDLLAGVTYWVAVQAEFAFPPQWGISPSVDQAGFTSRQGFPLLGIEFWDTDLGTDAAFRLHGVVPAPGALALLGLAGLAGRRRRR